MFTARMFYGLFGLGSLLLWVVAAESGWAPAHSVCKLPPSVRQSPGGYRSFHFWHSGYQMGK